MATVNEKMTTLANEIRTLSGTSETMGLDVIATNINVANNEITSQENLLNQIIEALSNKAGYNTVYIGTAVPTNDIGIDGDFYIVRGGTT